MSFLMEPYVFRPGVCDTAPAVNDPAQTQVIGPCIQCQQPQAVTVQLADLSAYRRGGYAQDVFPYLSADQREFLISGICGKCWDEMFAPPDDEDE
jgi:hypothetical protein